jgi:hypothetical protein
MLRFAAFVVVALSAGDALARSALPSTFPAEDVVLPRNGRPVFFTSGDTSFASVESDGTTTVLPCAAQRRAWRFYETCTVDPGTLDPDSVLVIRAEGDFVSSPSSWRVTDRVDSTPPQATGALIVEEVSRTTYGTTGPAIDFVVVSLESIADDSGPVLLRAEGDELDEVLGPHSSGGPATFGVALPAGGPRTSCFDAFAVDLAAQETHLGRVCADVGVSSCASAPAAPHLAILLLIPLRAMNRRWRTSITTTRGRRGE